jgi:nitroreductase
MSGALAMTTDTQFVERVDDLLKRRRSIRSFLPNQIDRTTILSILDVSARAASGANTQPWNVHVIAGDHKRRLSKAIAAAIADKESSESYVEDFPYYPPLWKSPYVDRRRKVGWDLYALLGIARENFQARQEQVLKNYDFFGAPVGILVTIERTLGQGSLIDCGLFLQNIVIAARARGIESCLQAAFGPYHRIVRSVLNLTDEQMLVCGVALGYENVDDPVNRLITERVPASEFARFYD